MVGNHDNLDTVARRLQQRLRFTKRRALGLDICLGMAVAGLLASVSMTLFGWSRWSLVVYSAIVGLALALFVALAWRMRSSALATLQRADHVLRSQERLSTAYEYLYQEPTHPFLPGLLAEAERVAPRVDPRVVFPTRWPRRLWALPVLVAALVGWSWLDMTPLRFDDLAQDEVAAEVRQEGERLEHWGRRLEELAKQQQLERSLTVARHMQDLGRRLQQESNRQGQAEQRISTLSEYLQRMQQELRERALMREVGFTTAQDVLMSGKSVKQELQDILELLQQDALPREMAAAAEQSVLRLSQQLGQNADLERLVQNLRAGNVEAARRLLKDVLNQQQAAEELEQLERAQRALKYSSRAIRRGESGGDKPSATSPKTPGDAMANDMPFDFDDETMSEDMPTMEDYATPGADEGYGVARHNRAGQSRHLQESNQPLSKVPVSSGEGDMRLAYIRYLPVRNDLHRPLEDVVVQYQHSAEEVLSRETIPRAYREQVKQYFLSIGVMSRNKP
jgi:hypothetical protein